jgi:hypothetical protein
MCKVSNCRHYQGSCRYQEDVVRKEDRLRSKYLQPLQQCSKAKATAESDLSHYRLRLLKSQLAPRFHAEAARCTHHDLAALSLEAMLLN